jgi:DNA processing protein
MVNLVKDHISQLEAMASYPKELFFKGNITLLEKRMISIVGTRKPNQYTKEFTAKLSSILSSAGVVIVSGAAMGVDAIAHSNAKDLNTIAVMANGLDIKYPAVNKSLISNMEENALVLSSYKEGTKATKYSFVHRNEIVVALGEILIVTEADLNSGSLRSVEYALKMGKTIYTIPHRIGQSQGTNKLLQDNKAKAIYDIDQFIASLGITIQEKQFDEVLEFCLNNPSYEEAVKKFPQKIFEYELLGKIKVENGKVIVL